MNKGNRTHIPHKIPVKCLEKTFFWRGNWQHLFAIHLLPPSSGTDTADEAL